MHKVYNEVEVTWSSIEKFYSYVKVNWEMNKSGIPVYTLFDEEGNKISINLEDCLEKEEIDNAVWQ